MGIIVSTFRVRRLRASSAKLLTPGIIRLEWLRRGGPRYRSRPGPDSTVTNRSRLLLLTARDWSKLTVSPMFNNNNNNNHSSRAELWWRTLPAITV